MTDKENLLRATSEYVTPAQAARIIGVTRTRVSTLMKAGRLTPDPAFPVPLLLRTDVEQFQDMPRPTGKTITQFTRRGGEGQRKGVKTGPRKPKGETAE